MRELRAECGRLSARLRTAKRAIAHRDEACTDAQVRVTLRVIAVSPRSLDLSAVQQRLIHVLLPTQSVAKAARQHAEQLQAELLQLQEYPASTRAVL